MLLLTLARKVLSVSPHTAMWLSAELAQLVEEEERAHASLRQRGLGAEVRFDQSPSSEAMVRALQSVKTEAEGQAVSKKSGAAAGKKKKSGDVRRGPEGGDRCDDDGCRGREEDTSSDMALREGAAPPATATEGVDGVAEASVTEFEDVGPSGACPSCAVCDYECYLSAVECELTDGSRCFLCPMHALKGEHEGAASGAEARTLLIFRDTCWIRVLLGKVAQRAESASAWVSRARRVLYPEEVHEVIPSDLDAAAAPACRGRASLEEASSVLDAGVQLGMDDAHVLKLRSVCKAACEAVAKAQSILSTGTRARRVSLSQCLECVAAVEGVPFSLPLIDELRALSAKGASWEAQAQAALRSPSVRALEVSSCPASLGACATSCAFGASSG